MIFLRRQLPLLITMVTGLVFAAQYYVPAPGFGAAAHLRHQMAADHRRLRARSSALPACSMSMPPRSGGRKPGWGYSFVLYAGMLGTIVVGLWNGRERNHRREP